MCFGFPLGSTSEDMAGLGTTSCYRSTGQVAVSPSDSLSVSVQVSGTSPGMQLSRLCTTPTRDPETLWVMPRLIILPTPLEQLLPRGEL